jgi:purine-binding chemotaxis protein CheW
MSTLTLENPQSAAKGTGIKYLTFQLGGESYGIAVLKIREIIRLQPATPVPQMPPYVKGVINLRGKIIPVIDLRIKFQLSGIQDTDQTCIVVVQVQLPGRTSAHMGLVVDGVEEVAVIAESDIEDPPDFGAQLQADYLLGMAKVKGVVKTLIDIDKVVAVEALQQATHQASAPE